MVKVNWTFSPLTSIHNKRHHINNGDNRINILFSRKEKNGKTEHWTLNSTKRYEGKVWLEQSFAHLAFLRFRAYHEIYYFRGTPPLLTSHVHWDAFALLWIYFVPHQRSLIGSWLRFSTWVKLRSVVFSTAYTLLANSKFGGDKICREFWQSQTNLVSLVRTGPEKRGSFSTISQRNLRSDVKSKLYLSKKLSY